MGYPGVPTAPWGWPTRHMLSQTSSFTWSRSGIVIWCCIQLVGAFQIEFPWSWLNSQVANHFLNPSMKGIFSFLPPSFLPSCYDAYTPAQPHKLIWNLVWLWQEMVQSPANGQEACPLLRNLGDREPGSDRLSVCSYPPCHWCLQWQTLGWCRLEISHWWSNFWLFSPFH